MDAQPPVVDRKNGVREDIGVAVALRVVEIDEQLLVVLVIVLVELGAAEDVDAFLVGFLEGLAQPPVAELLVAAEGDLADLDLVLAVDQEGDIDRLLEHRVVVDAHVHLRIAEALFREIIPDQLAVLVDHVIRELGAALEFEFLHQVLLLAFENPLEAPVVYARPLLQENFQVEAVAVDGGPDLHVGEKTLAPQPRDGVADVGAGQVDRIPRNQARRGAQDVVVEVFHPVDIDLADVV